MAIDSPLHLPDQPGPMEPDTTMWDGPDAAHRPAPGAGPRLLDRARAFADDLDALPNGLGQLGNDQLTDLVSVLLRLQARAGQVATVATANALDRACC